MRCQLEIPTCSLRFALQALSFYKIFGYPTGLGALLVRRDALPLLRKRYFGGGTVAVSVANTDYFRSQQRKHYRLISWLLYGTHSCMSCYCLERVLLHSHFSCRHIGKLLQAARGKRF